MLILYILVITAVIFQLLFVLHIRRNYRYVLQKSSKERLLYRPKAALIIPCKGLDTEFEKNIASFYGLDYDGYEIIFVTESQEDPAYEELCRLKEKFESETKAFDVRVLVAGLAETGSQKLHNLLYAYRHISDDVEVLAFADSDACLRCDWLSHIVYPLRKSKCGVASGYRWYVPTKNNLATLVLSAVNAKVAQNLGVSRFNQAWGGSMAVRVAVFEMLNIPQIWTRAISDDLTISRAAKQAKLKVAFVPACFVASYEQMSWGQFFEFARRQFLITRITTPGAWWFGLFGSSYSLLGFWGIGAAAVVSAFAGVGLWYIFALAAAVFYGSQVFRAVLRQRMIAKILVADVEKMRAVALLDIFGNPFCALILFICIISSAIGRTIIWRGIKYRLVSPTEIVMVQRESNY
ncbi:MAG: glycosyltransferase family 2 protein [Anaerohalosphaeraceae bacterium]|nr:glycosyltransferase family 2 protein [Anaerohalosphaeraceae bacterium]